MCVLHALGGGKGRAGGVAVAGRGERDGAGAAPELQQEGLFSGAAVAQVDVIG